MLPEKQYLALAECFSSAWSEMLSCSVSIISPESAGATKACCRIESPLTGAAAPTIWELDQQLAGAMVDAQAGAESCDGERAHGPLTPLEMALVHRAMERLRMAFNRQQVQSDVPDEAYLTEIGQPTSLTERNQSFEDDPCAAPIRFQVQLLQTHGTLTWWLDSQHLGLLADDKVELQTLTAVLAEFELPSSELEALSVGDVIATEQVADAPVLVYSDSGETMLAKLGQAGPQKAIQWLDAG